MSLDKSPIVRAEGTLCVVWDCDAKLVRHRSTSPALARQVCRPPCLIYYNETAASFGHLPVTSFPELLAPAVPAKPPRDAKYMQFKLARAHGYTGDVCPGCLNITMIRNGTCLKCTMCGETSGCS